MKKASTEQTYDRLREAKEAMMEASRAAEREGIPQRHQKSIDVIIAKMEALQWRLKG